MWMSVVPSDQYEREKIRADRYERALRVIREWDCLNPPDSSLCADHPKEELRSLRAENEELRERLAACKCT
jgi:hypothetical protein